jgi:hypothetical protein
MAASTKPSYTLSRHQPHTWSLHGKNGMLVSINMDTGETTFGDGYTLDDAVRIWQYQPYALPIGSSRAGASVDVSILERIADPELGDEECQKSRKSCFLRSLLMAQ